MENLIEILVEKMRNGIVSFVYRKKDGTERHAVGTIFGVGDTIKGTGKNTKCTRTLRYYDIECEAWRSFIIDNLISVGKHRKSTTEEHHQICLALVIKLKEKMKNEKIVPFAYREADGSVRHAHGRLTEISGEDDEYFTYFDTDKNEERKFRIDSFLGIGEPDEVIIESRFHYTDCSEKNSYTCQSEKSSESYSTFSDIKIRTILKKHGITIEETEDFLIVDLLPHLDKAQLTDLIIRATKRLAEL